MRRQSLLFVLIGVSLLLTGRLRSQADTLAWEYVINQAWTRPARLDTLANIHPRMLVNSGRIELLQTNLSTTHQFIWEVVQAKAEQYLTQSPAGNYGSESPTRSDGDAIPWLALTYLMTVDTRYLDKAISWITTVCNYPNWDGDNSLAAGHCLLGVSLGYDWLYHAMTPIQRVTIRDRLAYFAGRMAADKLSDSIKPTHYERYLSNHCQVEYTGLAAAGFALFGEHVEAEDWIRKAYNIFNEAYEISGEDGSSTEGHQYYGLMTEFQMHFNKMTKEILGIDFYAKSTWLSNVGNFILYSTLPDFTDDNCVMRYGDTKYNDWVSHGPTYQLFNLASEYRDPHLQWLALEMAARGIGTTDRMGWANLLWYDDTLLPVVPDTLPTFRHFEDTGWITSRSSWNDSDAVMIGFKCGPFHGHAVQELYDQMTAFHQLVNGHGHPDVNHFNMYAYGKWLAKDDAYSKPKWTALHNTIEVNGYGQIGEGSTYFNRDATFRAQATSRIIKAESHPDFDYIIGDAENIYKPESGLTSFKRHLVFLKPDVVVVLDELEAQQASQFMWLMHTAGNTAKTGQNKYRISTGDVLMDIHFLLPIAVTDNNEANVLRISPEDNTASTLILAVLHPYKTTETPVMSRLLAQNDSTITVEIDDGTRQKTIPLILAGSDDTMGALDPSGRYGPERLKMSQNYPNPFNPATQIDYSVRQSGPVQIAIFDILGHHVKTLVDDNQVAGEYTVVWDGRDATGQEVSSGLYFYTLRSDKSTLLTRKTVVLR
jgi:hypothetical protein